MTHSAFASLTLRSPYRRETRCRASRTAPRFVAKWRAKRAICTIYLADGSRPGGVKRTAGDGLMTRWDEKRDAIRVGTASGRGRNPVRLTASLRPDRVGQSQTLVDEKLQSVDEVVRDDDDQ